VIRAIHDAGLLQSAIFIVGYPGETGDDLRETIDFVAEHRARLSDVFAGSLVLLRGTPLWERREELEIEIIPGIPSHPAALRATCALYTFPHANWRLRDGTSELAQREARRERLQAAARELGVGTSSSGAEVQHLFD